MTLAIMLVFGVVAAFPVDAHAYYGYDRGYDNFTYNINPYGNYSGQSYSYNRPVQTSVVVERPVVIERPVYVQQPVYVQPTYYSNLYVTCSANNTYTTNGYVTWTAYVSGGNGYYTYSWSGTDGLYGSNQSVYFNYNNSGTKYAYVTVYSNGQSITQSCSNSVNVSYPYYNNSYSTYQANNYYQQSGYTNGYALAYQNNNLDIGCFVDPTNAKINQPVTWSVEVTGGIAPYRYSWSGSDGLLSSNSSVTKFYETTGTKNAIVTVTSADGKTGTRACSNTLAVGSTDATATKVAKASQSTNEPATQSGVKSNSQSNDLNSSSVKNSNLTAASLFSLSNVPWGWIAILIILVLFFTVLYLLLNRNKI